MISLHYNEMVQQFLCLLEADWNSKKVLLKGAFEKQINSKRRLEAIHSLQDLIEVLEKRDEVKEDSIEALNVVACICGNQKAASLLRLYNAGELLSDIPAAPTEESFPNARECIFKLISTEIGVRWKDLARNLGVPEAEIDRLAATNSPHISERVRNVMRHFEENCIGNAQYKATTLIRALQLSRRRDLANQVQDALDRIGGPCHVLK